MNTIQHTPRILVFDSGVGGLSVMREIQQRLPDCQYLYASDNAAFPYGTKSEDELIARVDKVLHALLQHIEQGYGPVDIIVVACNTASTLTLPHIRSHFTQPIVGVVPAIKPAAIHSATKLIGLLATPATVARPYTHDLIREYAGNCTVISVGSSELVHLAEQKLRGETIALEKIAAIVAPFATAPRAAELDTLVLACTHFPLLQDELRQCLPGTIQFIDSGEAIARRVAFLLHQPPPVSRTDLRHCHLALFTKATREVELLRAALSNFSLEKVDIVAC
ncbi:glutamate racemase [Cellvibrio sp. PSBB006]|uniref:glutamate racemase n=1 Tax=Cellvibrio sp. PSBB006 TaxID=1987723 RepID=UPI000B3B64EF|nr:glutamate racemase [Cellvibrio sp. PSBB006]ARU26240.1 glutamate racemase [Cellvibrio sp. PSBB006]